MNDTHAQDDDDLERRLRASGQLLDAPEPLVQAAIALWQRRAAPAARPRSLATLVFDSLAPGLELAAVRGAGSDLRQLLFQGATHDVDLRIRRSAAAASEGWSVGGQLLGPPCAGRAFLRCGEAYAATASWSAHGEFQFEPVPSGACVLVLLTDAWELELPALALPGPPSAADG